MRLVLAASLALSVTAHAFAQQSPAITPPQGPPPAGQVPTTPPPGPPPPAATPALAAREFKAPVGLLFNTVRADRVDDFEQMLAYLRAALDKATDPTVRQQARGWRFFKASEPGPNGTVLYVFELDPTVPNADYGLGRILADAYPDTTQLSEIWRLYRDSVTSGGSLLNLTPVMLKPLPAFPVTPPVTPVPPAKTP